MTPPTRRKEPQRTHASPTGTSTSSDETLAWWARARLGLAALVDLARLARPFGIRLLAIKGAHLHALAKGVSGRPMCDIDALLVEGQPQLLEALLRAGVLAPFVLIGADQQALHVQSPGCPFVLDVHVRPFPRFFGRLSAADLRRRARAGGPLLQGVVELPDPIDGALLALVHHAKDGLDGRRRTRLLRDLDTLEQQGSLASNTLAERACAHRVRAMVTLALLDLSPHDARCASVLANLRPGAAERIWLDFVRHALASPRVRRGSRRSYWLLRAVRDDGWDVALSLGWQALLGMTRRARRLEGAATAAVALQWYAVARVCAPIVFRWWPLEVLNEFGRSDAPNHEPQRTHDAAEVARLVQYFALLDAWAQRVRLPNTCLYRAASRYAALRSMGLDVELVLGVRVHDGSTEGHAWTEFRRQPIPAEDVEGYRVSIRFPHPESRRAPHPGGPR